MSVLVVTPPEPLVSLEDAKAHLRVTDGDEDALIQSYIDAASAWIDGPSGWLGRCIGAQVIEVRYGGPFGPLPFLRSPLAPMPIGPLLSLEEAAFTGPDGIEQAIDVADFDVVGDALDCGHGRAWVTPANRVRLRYRAGYASTPKPVAQAVLLLVGQWFQFREAASDLALREPPFAVRALLGPYRNIRI